MVAVCLLPVDVGLGALYHVDPSGSDDNAGTAESPFRTVSKAAQVAQAGDECVVRPGVYRETVRLSASGTVGNPIRLTAAAGKEDQGFLGRGGVEINDAERAALREIAGVLGVAS